jgi:hypothetical protein
MTNTVTNLMPVTLKSTPLQRTNICCIERGILLLEAPNFTLFHRMYFASLSAEHIADLGSNQDHR